MELLLHLGCHISSSTFSCWQRSTASRRSPWWRRRRRPPPFSLSSVRFPSASYIPRSSGWECVTKQMWQTFALIKLSWSIDCYGFSQAIMGGVCGFWGGVFTMGFIYLLMVTKHKKSLITFWELFMWKIHRSFFSGLHKTIGSSFRRGQILNVKQTRPSVNYAKD